MSVCCFYIIFLNKVLAIQTIVWYNIVVIKKIKEEFYIEENEEVCYWVFSCVVGVR